MSVLSEHVEKTGVQNRTWAVYSAEIPSKKQLIPHLLGFRYHSCTFLMDTTDQENPVILGELHFGPKSTEIKHSENKSFRGKLSDYFSLYVFNPLAEASKLKKPFQAIAKKLGQDHRIFYLKPSSYTVEPRDLSKTHLAVHQSGSPQEILHLWNNMHLVAMEIGELNNLFINVPYVKSSLNCRAGTRAMLEAFNFELVQLGNGLGKCEGMKSNLPKRVGNIVLPAMETNDIYALIDQNEGLKTACNMCNPFPKI